MQIWAEDGPDETGHTVRVPFHTAARGVYALYFSGNGLTRLAAPTTISPFGWRIDGGPEHEVREAIAAAPDIANAGEGLFPLGEVVLEPGAHTFILRLLDRRGAPDQNYALWFDAVVLRWLSWE